MASAALLWACDDSQQLLSSAKITVPDTMEELFTNGVTLDASAQDIDVKFTANSTWTIEFSCDTPDGVNWVYADPARGDGGDVEMKVSVMANESEMSRTATATVTCYSVTGDVTKSFTITQEGKAAAQTSGLTIDPDKVTVLKNEKFHLTAKDASGNPVSATWSTGDTMVARVDNNGDVQAINPGSTVITAEAGGLTATCDVTVTDEIPVESIAFDPDYIEMNIGDQRQLTVVFTPENATNRTINVWTVDGGNPNVTVDDKGVVTAVSKGNAVVIAAINQQLIARCTIKINDPDNPDIPVESITLDKTEASVYTKQEEPLILTATVTPAEALNGKSVQWKSDDPNVVMVTAINATQAKVTGVSVGKTSVSAHLGDKSASCEVTVQAPPTVDVTGISLDKTALELSVYQSYALTATITPSNATDKTVTWTSSNTDVARVLNEDGWGANGTMAKAGTVTAYSAGEAIITASAGGFTAQCKVTVTDNSVAITGITLNKTSLELTVGQTSQLIPTLQPEDASSVSVTWQSSNTSVATVTNGLVRAVAAGETIITASADGVSAQCKVTVKAESVEEAVDLGLPSGLKWRGWNVGASKPEEYGDYYAWGEKTTKADYSWTTYKWGKSSSGPFDRYGDDRKTQFSDYDYADDAARAVLGDGWRTPTSSEWTELLTKCSWKWTTSNGVKGMMVTGPNGNSIFLPAAGYKGERGLTNAGSYGDYWSSTLSAMNMAYSVDFYSSGQDKGNNTRNCGLPIRPVKN